MDSTPRRSHWIIAPALDLACFTAGWAVLFFIPYLSPQHTDPIRTFALAFFTAHRYFTFLLVYLDRAEFNRRRGTYILTPIVTFSGVGLCYFFRVDEPEMFAFWYLFNYFHFVTQKYGILRIYSRKSGRDSRTLERWAVYAWGLAGLLYMFCYRAEEGTLMHYLRTLLGGLRPSPLVAQGTFLGAAALTGLYLARTVGGPVSLHLPRLLFFGSVLFMYGVCPVLSTEATAIATSFSHAVEYIALVNLAVKNKVRNKALDSAILRRAADRAALNTFLFIAAVSVALYGVRAVSLTAFYVVVYGSSFAHFVFDGMIWKLRRPDVARGVGAVPVGQGN